jgi:hypothetical protein
MKGKNLILEASEVLEMFEAEQSLKNLRTFIEEVANKRLTLALNQSAY